MNLRGRIVCGIWTQVRGIFRFLCTCKSPFHVFFFSFALQYKSNGMRRNFGPKLQIARNCFTYRLYIIVMQMSKGNRERAIVCQF